MAAASLAVGIGARAALLGGIAFAALELLAHQLYATSAILVGVAGVLLAELARHVSSGDRMLERFVAALGSGELEHPPSAGGFRRGREAMERAIMTMSTARLRPQQQIDQLQTLIDTVPVAIITRAEDGTVTAANRAARRLAGRAISRAEDLKAIDPAALQLLQLAPGQRQLVRFANGERVLASAACFRAAGQELRVFSLQNIASELEGAELRAWQDLLRVLAHEMMNSLTPIASLAESIARLLNDLRQSSPSPKLGDVAEAVEVIARRSAGLMSFVDQYRRMAELPPPVLERLSAADFVRRIDQLMRPTAGARGIHYASSIDPPDLLMRADRNLLEQAVINLLHNAMDAATPAEHPSVALRCQLRDEHCSISVYDNGSGVDSTLLEQIFVPFFTTKPGGSGIGLSLARQIAHAHHGQLEAFANQPSGAVFTLSIPSG